MIAFDTLPRVGHQSSTGTVVLEFSEGTGVATDFCRGIEAAQMAQR